MKNMTSANWRKAAGLACIATLISVGAACVPPASSVASATDTFVVSTNPTATRGTDAAIRVMNSDGKVKLGYLSFPTTAASGTTVSGTVLVYPRQSGFNVGVANVGAFSNATTYASRPTLGNRVGSLASTTANQQAQIAVSGLNVVNGRINVALSTTSLFELELVSADGAAANNNSAMAPTLELSGTSTTTPPTTTVPGWNMTFDDEFSGTKVDTSKWNVYDQAKGDSVESPKSDTCPLSKNVTEGGGKLVMRTIKANGSCSNGQLQSGAGMNTWGTFQQAGGRFEARLRWTSAGNYAWGGFWTHGNGGPGWTKDNANEVDIIEYIGKNAEPNIHRFKPAIHYNYTCQGTCGTQNMAYQPFDVTAWHTYTMEWEQTNKADPTTMQIRIYLDNQEITRFDKSGTWRVAADGSKTLETAGGWHNPNGAFPNPYGLDKPMKLILSAWVGGPGVDPATVAAGFKPANGHNDLEVDYVRVYKR